MMSNVVKISKFLSMILRHKPEVVGISLDKHGWANVGELIEKISKVYPLNMELLEEIVKKDEKQRYSFSENKQFIRANQGHTIPVDVELAELVPPEVLWHGSAEKYEASIGEIGLIPKARLYVHLSKDYDTALKVGRRHGKPIVYRVLSGEMAKDGYLFFCSKNGVWLTKDVPVKYIERVLEKELLDEKIAEANKQFIYNNKIAKHHITNER